MEVGRLSLHKLGCSAFFDQVDCLVEGGRVSDNLIDFILWCRRETLVLVRVLGLRRISRTL